MSSGVIDQHVVGTEVHADVCVVGAGPAGIFCALALAELGIDVVSVKRELRVCADRLEALTGHATDLVARLGLPWSALGATTELAGFRSAWGAERNALRDVIHNAGGPPRLVRRSLFDAALIQEALRRSVPVHTAYGVPVAIRVSPENWQVESPCLDQSRSIKVVCRVLVDASGRTMALRGACGRSLIKSEPWVCAEAYIPDVQREEGERFLLVESTPSGWWVGLSEVNNGEWIGHGCPAEQVPARLSARHDWFLGRLQASELLGPLTEFRVGAPRIRRCGLEFALPFAGPTWMAVGDAALGLSPLSGQGLTEAILGAQKCAAAIDTVLRGDTTAPAQYDHQLRLRARAYIDRELELADSAASWHSASSWPAQVATLGLLLQKVSESGSA